MRDKIAIRANAECPPIFDLLRSLRHVQACCELARHLICMSRILQDRRFIHKITPKIEGEFPNMALNMTETTARLTLAVSLSTILAACSAVQGPTAQVVDRSAPALERDQAQSLTKAVTRGYVDADQIEAEAPNAYTVVPGDTLWDISDLFLKEPWRWGEIWGHNPSVYDPNLIYPGDILTLTYVNGRPIVMLNRNGISVPQGSGEPGLGAATPSNGNSAAGTRAKLSPRIRSVSIDSAIPTISADSISQFLVHPKVVDLNTLESAPYVMANSDERLISSVGSKVYVRGRMNRNQTHYGVFRKNKALLDPVTGVNLGYEVTHVSDAKLLSVGDPSTLGLTSNRMETISGDILLPLEDEQATHAYVPRMPELRGDARIVSLVNAISKTGRDQVVVLNIGNESNIQQGDVLAVETLGKTVVEQKEGELAEDVKLPNQRTGVLMVFKTFDKVSYALVMESTRPLKVNDMVTGI